MVSLAQQDGRPGVLRADVPWRRLADDGIALREWRIDPETGHLDPARLAPLLADGKVRLVAFPHCSNVVAEINPVAEIVALAHAAGAVCCVDGVSYAPHGLPDVAALGADIYLFSAYKVYGPHQGIMAIREDLGMRLPEQGHYFNAGTLYKRFTPAGPDHAQIAASAGIADYFDALHGHHFAPEPDAAVEKGPFEIELGEHKVLLRQRDGRYLRMVPVLVTSKPVTRDEIRRRRRELVRMLFFLVSHRDADSVADADGEARLAADLKERFGNVIRTGPIDRLAFRTFEVVRETADAGP